MEVRLLEFKVNGLYGLYNHKVLFDQPENISILHGPNGVGKTAFLKCIRYLFAKDFEGLLDIPFESISLMLSSGDVFNIHRVLKEGENDIEARKLEIALVRGSETYKRVYVPRDHANMLPWSRASRISRQLSFDDAEPDAKTTIRRHAMMKIDSALDSVMVRFVETNRLFRPSRERSPSDKDIVILTVQECAKDLVSHIASAVRSYGARSQKLDQSFPRRFLSETTVQLGVDELKSRLAGLEKKLNGLRDINLLDADALYPFDLGSLDSVEQSKIDILSLYVRDSEKKLAGFDSIAARVTMLLESLKKKLRNKKVLLSRERGLYVQLDSGDEIPLEALSSGEQHELVLMYELLFKVPAGALVLIDEPELSLHVSWQKAFLPELISIAAEVGFAAVIATHSPFIVGDRHDLMVALDAEVDDE
ncbi:AAA family ATPase [Pseudomonas sp. LB3P38]|uniref:AAA family ATPase n=1 Tax=Pseudomonas lyxosi TaxID=3398358 RepID=UPI0039EE17A4